MEARTAFAPRAAPSHLVPLAERLVELKVFVSQIFSEVADEI